jgi:hypothetical protein
MQQGVGESPADSRPDGSTCDDQLRRFEDPIRVLRGSTQEREKPGATGRPVSPNEATLVPSPP